MGFYWSYCPVKLQKFSRCLQYSSIGWDNGLAPNRRQAIISTNDDPVQRRIYASLGVNELRYIYMSFKITRVRFQLHYSGPDIDNKILNKHFEKGLPLIFIAWKKVLFWGVGPQVLEESCKWTAQKKSRLFI